MTSLTVTSVTPVTAAVRRRWWQALTVVLAGVNLAIGVLSPTPSIRWPFLLGAVLVVGALAAASRSRLVAWIVLVIGVVAPIATTWWSVVGPVTALLILGCGAAAIRMTSTSTSANLPAPPAAPGMRLAGTEGSRRGSPS